MTRSRYYARLVGSQAADVESDTLRIPDHILPIHFLIPKIVQSDDGKQSSFLTIFAIW